MTLMFVSQEPPTYTWSVRREPTSDGVLGSADGAHGGADPPAADAVHVEMPHAVMTEVVQDAVQGVRSLAQRQDQPAQWFLS